MGNGYKVRIYESCDKDGATGSGTVVLPVDPSFTISADSADKVLDWIRTNVIQNNFLSCRVYQVCPMTIGPELVSSVAIGPNGSFVRVLLDPVSGPYGQLRRVRCVGPLFSSIGSDMMNAAASSDYGTVPTNPQAILGTARFLHPTSTRIPLVTLERELGLVL